MYNEVVIVAHFFLDFSDVFAREARYDTIHEGSADIIVFLEPLFEACIVSSEIVFPEFDILADTILEVMSVEENELARHENQTFGWVSVECFVAAEEQLNEFTGIGRSGCVAELAGIVKRNTRFCGVRDYETAINAQFCEYGFSAREITSIRSREFTAFPSRRPWRFT